MAATKRAINLQDPIDRQRYRCPIGHAQWEAWDGYFYCYSCADSWEVSPEFDELHDLKTGETVHRESIEFIWE